MGEITFSYKGGKSRTLPERTKFHLGLESYVCFLCWEVWVGKSYLNKHWILSCCTNSVFTCIIVTEYKRCSHVICWKWINAEIYNKPYESFYLFLSSLVLLTNISLLFEIIKKQFSWASYSYHDCFGCNEITPKL